MGCIMAELIRGGVMFPGSDRILNRNMGDKGNTLLSGRMADSHQGYI